MTTKRRFIYMDFLPNALFGRGKIIDLLLNSSVGKYVEFKPVHCCHILSSSGFMKVTILYSSPFPSIIDILYFRYQQAKKKYFVVMI
jgi:RAB protein geranylgeranyltransferase component A